MPRVCGARRLISRGRLGVTEAALSEVTSYLVRRSAARSRTALTWDNGTYMQPGLAW